MRIPAGYTLERLRTPFELREIAPAWNELASAGGSPFLTVEWLVPWWNAFGSGTFTCLVLRDGIGGLRAGICCRREPGGRLSGTANVHSSDWDGLAADEDARGALWSEVAALGADTVNLPAVRNPLSLEAAQHALRSAGYSVAATPWISSPFMTLPASWDELMGRVSRNLRRQFGRLQRALQREGRLGFRTTSEGERLEPDLHAFFDVEASGWKSRSGTAILSDPRTTSLYTSFARGLAQIGSLRIHLLELDGRVIAGDLGCSFAGGSFLIKTGFDERFARLSPGLVLRGEVLRASIEEGSRYYDFLGGPDWYKLRWGAQLRPRVTVRGFRGWRRPLALYHARLRPPLRAAVLRARELRPGGSASR